MTERKLAKLTRDSRNYLEHTISNLCARRLYAIPFPIPSDDKTKLGLVRSTIDHEVLIAVDILASCSMGNYMLRTSNTCQLAVGNAVMDFSFNIPQHVVPTSYTSELPQEHIVNVPYRLHSEHSHYDALNKWCLDMLALKHRCNKAKDLFMYIIERCNTAGQLARVWPQCVKFLPSEYIEALGKKERISQIPPSINMLRVNDERDEATSTLALLHLLPSAGNISIRI